MHCTEKLTFPNTTQQSLIMYRLGALSVASTTMSYLKSDGSHGILNISPHNITTEKDKKKKKKKPTEIVKSYLIKDTCSKSPKHLRYAMLPGVQQSE